MTRRTPSTTAVVNQPIPIRSRTMLHTAAPAVQSASPPSPRAVHFSETSDIVSGFSRPLTQEEAWLLYDFETHCRDCRHCISPYKRFQSGAPLCHKGKHMSKRISEAMFMQKGNVFERYTLRTKPIRVEIPHTYTYLREQLHAMEDQASIRHARRQATEERTRVRVHNDSHRRSDEPRRSSSTEVVIEAGRTDDRRRDRYRHEEPQQTLYHDREREHSHSHSRREHRSDYRHEEPRERERRRAAEVTTSTQTNSRERRYRTQERRPTWVEEDVRARR